MAKTLKRLAPLGLIILLIAQALSPSGWSLVIPCRAEGAGFRAADVEDSNLTIEDVTVEGNRLVPTEDILGVVKTRRGDRFDRDQVLNDLKAVNGMGYFDDRNLQVVPELSSNGVLLKIRVQENAPITEFAFQGNQALSTEEITKMFADQLGKPQNLNQLSGAIDKLEQAYHDRGYVLARVVDVKDDPDGSVNLTINEGVVNDIQVTGNRKTKDFIIRSAIKLKAGSVYNERQLTADLRKLYANGYFQDIRRSLVPSQTDPDKYTLKVEVDEKRTGSVGLGGGVDSVAGPFGSFSFSDSNFRGRGQVLSFNSQIGSGMFGQFNNIVNNGGTNFLSNKGTYQAELTWIEPNLRGTDTSLAVSGFARNYNSMLVDNSQQRTLGTSVTFTKPLGHHFNASLGFTGEQTVLQDAGGLINNLSTVNYLAGRALALGQATDLASAQQVASQVRSSQLQGGAFLTVNPALHYDTRDNPVDPTSGINAKLTASPSLGLTAASFAKLGASFSKFIPVTKETSLAFNIQGGSSLGGTPQFAQYRLGGWNGLRGYRSFSDLGTGTSMLMASAEIRRRLPIPLLDPSNKLAGIINPVIKNVKTVAFFDAGQVSGNGLTNSYYQRSTLGASVGFGLRVNLPMIGVVRLDYGFPLISTLLGKMTPRFTLGFGDKF